ncbi:MAG: hypothetical protein COB30_007920 [Ectothiorhodospiraceae bacterium]|nr:hypothetical protein [Ectothiorhodospiraceae bacterium]
MQIQIHVFLPYSVSWQENVKLHPFFRHSGAGRNPGGGADQWWVLDGGSVWLI